MEKEPILGKYQQDHKGYFVEDLYGNKLRPIDNSPQIDQQRKQRREFIASNLSGTMYFNTAPRYQERYRGKRGYERKNA